MQQQQRRRHKGRRRGQWRLACHGQHAANERLRVRGASNPGAYAPGSAGWTPRPRHRRRRSFGGAATCCWLAGWQQWAWQHGFTPTLAQGRACLSQWQRRCVRACVRAKGGGAGDWGGRTRAAGGRCCRVALDVRTRTRPPTHPPNTLCALAAEPRGAHGRGQAAASAGRPPPGRATLTCCAELSLAAAVGLNRCVSLCPLSSSLLSLPACLLACMLDCLLA